MSKKYVFLSFDFKDAASRDLFINASGKHMPMVDTTQWSRKFKNDDEWKKATQERIAKVHIMVVLIGQNTHRAEGVLWEIASAKEQSMPLLGVQCDKDRHGTVPALLSDRPIIEWRWDDMEKHILELAHEE